ncbi:MAG: hypothetical protein JST90_08070 [Bacteroidetes bacterium]|nr:hypothetical protein [Bacteroidota bacterium]
MKNVVLVLCFATLANVCAAQSRLGYIDTVSAERPFYYHYIVAGLGSGLGHMLPNMEIKGHTLTYKISQNSYWGKPDKVPDTIFIGQVPSFVIDSIVSLVKGVQDSDYFDSNPLVMSGVFNDLKIAVGLDTVEYELMNTTNELTQRTLEMLNPYLPADLKWENSRELIKEEQDAWKQLLADEVNDSIPPKKKSHKKQKPYQWK